MVWGSIVSVMGYMRSIDIGGEFNWWPIFWTNLFSWTLWAIIAPLIFWFCRKFRFDKSNWVRTGLINLAFSVFIAAAHLFLHILLGSVAWSSLTDESFQESWDGFISFGIIYWRGPWSYIVYWMLFGSCHALDYYSELRQRQLRNAQLQKQLAEAQLQVLKLQLHPHFLFNTIHSAVALVKKGYDSQAIDMLTSLSDLLRVALESATEQEVMLSRELDFLNKYIEIEKIRFSDRLTVIYEIDPETKNALVPGFILQPIAENAFRHGIEKNAGAGTVWISSQRSGDSLIISIRNSGNRSKIRSIETVKRGIGISSTCARLETLYGKHQSFSLSSLDDGTTIAVMEIPFMTVNEQHSIVASENV